MNERKWTLDTIGRLCAGAFLLVGCAAGLQAQGISPDGWIRQDMWSAIYLDTVCGNGNATCEGCGPADDQFDGAGHFDTDWLGGADPTTFILVPGADLAGAITPVAAGGTGPGAFRGGSVVHALTDFGNGDVINHDAVLAALTDPDATDNVYGIAQTVIENTGASDKLVNICSSSDDSIIVFGDTNQLYARSVCRGTAGGCTEGMVVTVPPGMHILTTITHEGGGGFGFRLRLEDGCGPVVPGGDIVFHGPPPPTAVPTAEIAASADAIPECPFATDRDGDIFAKNFTMLFAVDNPLSSTGGGPRVLSSTDWLTPHDLTAEDPKVGDAWDDLDRTHHAAGHLGGSTWESIDSLIADHGVPNLNPTADILNFQHITVQTSSIAAGDIQNDNVLSATTLYVNNKTGAPMDVGICTASDDSVQAWVNRQLVTTVSQPRGVAPGCAEIGAARLIPGINKITVLVYEGGGGWGQRLRIIKGDGTAYSDRVDGTDDLEIIGPRHADYAAAASPELFALNERTSDLNSLECPQPEMTVTLTGNGLNDTSGIDVWETLTGSLETFDVVDVSHGGTVQVDTVADSTEPNITALPNSVLVGTDNGGVSVNTDNGGGSYTSTSSTGGDIWTGGDSFMYQYDLIDGDFDIAIEITGYSHATDAGRWGKFGLMARQTADTGDGMTLPGETGRRYTMVQAHGPATGEAARVAVRTDDTNVGSNSETPIDPANIGARPRFLRLTRRGNVFQGWASDDAGLGDGTKNPCNDGNWIAGRQHDWGDGAPTTVALGFANSEHNSNGAVAQTVDYQVLSCVSVPEPITGISVHWEGITAAEANEGLSYTVLPELDMSGSVNCVTAVHGPDQTGTTWALDTFNWKPQAGPIGEFDIAHDFGSVNFAGSTTFDGTSYTVSGSGPDIWSSGDNMHFAYKTIAGDFDLKARITSVDHPDAGQWGRYGLMARNSCHPQAKHSFSMHTTGATVHPPRHQFRPIDRMDNINDGQQLPDGILEGYPNTGDAFIDRHPEWIRLIRRGDAIFSQMAFDDPANPGNPIQWCTVGYDRDLNRPDEMLVGFAVGSHNSIDGQALVHVTFDNFSCVTGLDVPDVAVPGAELNTLDFSDPGQIGIVVVGSGAFTPNTTAEGRLRLTEDGSGSSATAVWYGVPAAPEAGGVPLAETGFVVEYDAFMVKPGNCDPGADPNPADGMTFAVFSTGESDGLASAVAAYPDGLGATDLVGAPGGALGYEGGTITPRRYCNPSFAVEHDNWVGGGDNEVADGGSPNNDCNWHLGLDYNGSISSLQNNAQAGVLSPDLPDIYAPEGVHIEVYYSPTGLVEVYATANDGSTDRLLVLAQAIPPLSAGDLVLGFTGGTGGATATQEIDNFSVSVLCEESLDEVTIAGPTDFTPETDATLTATFVGDDGAVTYAWSIVSGPGEIVGAADGADVQIHCTGTGDVVVRVEAGDGTCEDLAAAEHTISCACPIDGDTHCEGLTLEQVAGDPTMYNATASGVDDSGDAVLYTFTATNGAASFTVGPQTDNTALLDLSSPAGEWTITVTVDDDENCPDEAADNSCEETVISGGLQLPGDCNQDGMIDIADGVCIVSVLFLGRQPSEYPCGDGTSTDPANVELLDVNGGGSPVDLADAVWLLAYQFQGGPPPVQGLDCIIIVGCPDNPGCP